MTALLVADPQIATRSAPVIAMRQNSASPGPKLCENMSEFMSQSAIDFGLMLKQPRIQRNEFLAIISATSSCFQTGIPFDTEFARNSIRAVSA
jgi:hypothetical protein